MTELPIEASGPSSLFRDVHLDCTAVSIPSPDRQRNEDRYVFAAPGLPATESAGIGSLFLVADGSSAGGRGALAAQATIDVVSTILREKRAMRLRPDLLELKLLEANDVVAGEVRGRSTATGLWLWEVDGPDGPRLEAGWANVGDSRLYHRGRQGWAKLTTDHGRGRILLRAIGDGVGLMVETGRLQAQEGDEFVLLTDGVWKRACPVRLRWHDDYSSAADLVRYLVTTARANGSVDDATAIVVRVLAPS